MPHSRDQYVLELADTCDALFANGQHSISATEIAHTHFPERALGGDIIEGIRKRLPKIREILELDYQRQVCLLSQVYFARFRRIEPETNDTARACLPFGQGRRAEGIRLNRGPEDLIYRESLRQNLVTGAGKYKHATDRTITALDSGDLTVDDATELLQTAQRKSLPIREIDTLLPSPKLLSEA